MNSSWSYCPETANSGQVVIFCPVRPWNLTDDLEKNRASFLSYFKLCASFRSHWRIQTEVTVRKRPIWVKIDDFFPLWIWNLTATSSYVHHFVALCKFKMDLMSRYAQIGTQVALTSMTLTFDLDFCMGFTFFNCNNSELKISWWSDDRNIVKNVLGRSWNIIRALKHQRDIFVNRYVILT